jgi:hypothetical protein
MAHRPHFTPQKHYFYVSGIHFCQKLSKPQGLVRPEGLGKFKNSPHRGIEPAIFRFVVLTTALPRAPYNCCKEMYTGIICLRLLVRISNGGQAVSTNAILYLLYLSVFKHIFVVGNIRNLFPH